MKKLLLEESKEAKYSKLSLSRLKADLRGYRATVVQDSAPNRHLVLGGGGPLGEEIILLYFDGYLEVSSDLGRHTVTGRGDMLEWIVRDGDMLVTNALLTSSFSFNRMAKWIVTNEKYWRRSINLTPESIDGFDWDAFVDGVWARFDDCVDGGTPENQEEFEEIYEELEGILCRKKAMTGPEAYRWAEDYERNGFNLKGMWEEDTRDLLLSYVWSYRIGYLVSKMWKEGEL